MKTDREIFFETLKPGGKPERTLCQYEAHYILDDPMKAHMRNGLVPGATIKNPWGVTLYWGENEPGYMPIVNERTRVCPDVAVWRETVHAPDPGAHCTEAQWRACREEAEHHRADKVITALVNNGILEQLHFLMGFEDTLINFYEEPEAMAELIDYITDYKIRYLRDLTDNVEIDALLAHDDWGSSSSLFVSPDMWREFFKEPYRRFYGFVKERGIRIIHHADSYLVPIVEDMIELGIDVWQGVLPENNIPKVQEAVAGRLTLMGGIGSAIDRVDSTEEEIRAYVRNVCESCCPGGNFIPCITYGGPGAIYPHVDAVVDDEIRKYDARRTGV